MRRTSVEGLALALLLALATASPASASQLTTLRDDGTVVVREDPLLPPADPWRAPSRAPEAAAPAAPAAAARAVAASASAPAPAPAAAAKPTMRGELGRMLVAGEIDQATHDAHRSTYYDARKLRSKLRGARRVALGAVLRNLEDVAASGGLTASRLPALFATVARNRQWWSQGPLLRNGARVSFQGSRIVWQHYAGEGLQIQWLGTFGKANGLWSGRFDAGLRTLLDEALALAAQRAGGIAWEYLFRFDGGRPPWVSGLAQGTAVQALARAAARLGDPRYLDAARAALGIFREPPPSGVRLSTPLGAHYLIYSFAPGLQVLNAFVQALNGLHDYALLAADPEGPVLFAAGEAQLRAELPAYDTGAWSRYSNRRESDLHYHKLSRDFLRNLCQRLTANVVTPVTPATPAGGTPAPTVTVPPPPATGGTVAAPPPPPPAPPPAAADATPYCGAAQRFTDYLSQPPRLRLVSKRIRGGRPAVVRFELSKPAQVTLTLRRGGRTLATLGGRFGSGRRSLRWRRPPRPAAKLTAVLRATDLAGNHGAADGELTLLRARRRR